MKISMNRNYFNFFKFYLCWLERVIHFSIHIDCLQNLLLFHPEEYGNASKLKKRIKTLSHTHIIHNKNISHYLTTLLAFRFIGHKAFGWSLIMPLDFTSEDGKNPTWIPFCVFLNSIRCANAISILLFGVTMKSTSRWPCGPVFAFNLFKSLISL